MQHGWLEERWTDEIVNGWLGASTWSMDKTRVMSLCKILRS